MRERYRTFPDWCDTGPGWSNRIRVYDSSKKLTSSTVQSGHFMASDRGASPKGLEYTQDENHIEQLKGFKSFEFHGDVGGEFFLQRSATVSEGNQQRIHGELQNYPSAGLKSVYDYTGPVYAIPPGNNVRPSGPVIRDLKPIGTHAIALVKPTNNVANLATDLAEIRRDGLPHLWGVESWKARTFRARQAGDEYLNQEFGWAPLVSDVRGASYAAANAHRLLKSYERNSHKMVRRRYEFPIESSESWQVVSTGQFPWFPDRGIPTSGIISGALGTGDILRCTRFYRRTWFSGAFTYHLPIGFNSRYKLIRAASQAGPLLGIELTPEVIWNATPWTWALDWVSNAGDCISIYSDMQTDGLVIKYGYIMEHCVQSVTTYYGPKTAGSGGFKYPASSVTSFLETKTRKKATPFGFEVSWSSFSPRQLAIAAALGLSRAF